MTTTPSPIAANRADDGLDPNPTAVVIGAGSGGLTVAIGLSKFGRRVRLVERGRVGGDCTNVGCIPSKALLHATARPARGGQTGAQILASVRAKRDELWRHETEEFGSTEGIDLQFGSACVVAPGRVEVTAADGTLDVIESDNVVIATGSRPREIPIDGLCGQHQLTNENLFELEQAPAHLAIVGAGPIGVEMATAFARLGTRVTLLDAAERVLPIGLAAASELVTRSLTKAGVDVRTGRIATSYDAATGRLQLGTLSGSDPDRTDEAVEGVDRVLVAVGRVPNSDGLGLEELGIETDGGGRIIVDGKSRSSVSGIWAVGDVSDRGGTTHAANAWGRRIIKAIIAPPAPAGPEPIIPAVTFADPEVASIGVQPAEVPADVRRIVVDLDRSDRAFTDEATDGIVIVDVRRFSGRVLGATIVGPRAGELISIFSLAMKNGIRFPKWYGVVWPYPAYADVLGHAVDDFMTEHLANLHRDFPRWLMGRLRRT